MKDSLYSIDKTATYIGQIRDYYPDLAINTAQLLTIEGQFSDVLKVNDALIFRFPRTPHVAKDMRREVAVLKALQGKLPLPIPEPIYLAEDAQTGEGIFMGYAMIAGHPLSRDVFARIMDETILNQIAQDLAVFLNTLHSLPPDSLNVDFEIDGTRDSWIKMYQDFEVKLFPYMRPEACQQITANFEAALNDTAMWVFEPLLCHGDFGTGNILYANGHITGIIDFAFCGPGDPAQEVGALLASYGHEFVERIFIHYPELRHCLRRAEFIRSNYALIQSLYALRDGNQEDFEDGLRDYV